MKLITRLLLLSFFITQAYYMNAQTEVPLIDRDIFFDNAEVSSGSLSPDGKHIAFLKEYEDAMNVYVKGINDDFDDAKMLTNSKTSILGFFWTYDSKYIIFANDNEGDENLSIFAVDPKAHAEGQVPPSRNLTPQENSTARLYAVSRKDPNIIMLGLNDRDESWHDLYKLNIATGELELQFENNERITGWDFDWDENARFAYRTDENGFSQILAVDENNEFTQIYETNSQESAYVAAWNKDNTKAYLVSNKGDVNLTTLYLMDPADGSVTKVESDPLGKVDFGGARFNRNTREMLYTAYTDDKTRRYFKDDETKEIFAFLEKEFPNREIGISSSTKNYEKMLIALSGDRYATDVYLFDTETKELTFQYTPKPQLKEVERYLAPMVPISYKSSDGLEIPAYLTVPVGMEGKNLPVVVFVHGGPKGPRDYWGYSPAIQFLANRGYAVLQPNFRASGGYGKEFLNAGDREWGKLMQDDITWGVKHLIKEGIADKDRVAIMGGSYGGYATLAGLTFTPEVYACGVDLFGPSNLYTLLESIPPYWEAGRMMLYEMTGNPETEEGKKLIEEASPLFHVDEIKKPLLIFQGANDPRVKKAESDQIVIAMRNNGQDVQYLLAADEGHGLRNPLNRLALFAKTEMFLAEHIGGRYQESMDDEVSEKLDELTVDINTVVLQEKPEVEVLQEMPKVDLSLEEGVTEYEIVMNMQGKDMEMSSSRTITNTDQGLEIKDVSKGQQGESTDKTIYNEKWHVVSRHINQGPMNIPMVYTTNSVSLEVMGNKMDIEADGLIVSDGGGYDILVPQFVPNKGDKVSYYIADIMTGKEKQVIAENVGMEEGMTKIEIVSVDNENDKMTMWIDGKMAAKIIQVLPQFGNAIMTMTRK